MSKDKDDGHVSSSQAALKAAESRSYTSFQHVLSLAVNALRARACILCISPKAVSDATSGLSESRPTCALLYSRHIENAVGINIECHHNLRHPARSRRNASEVELAQQVVVLCAGTLAFVHLYRDSRLIIAVSTESLQKTSTLGSNHPLQLCQMYSRYSNGLHRSFCNAELYILFVTADKARLSSIQGAHKQQQEQVQANWGGPRGVQRPFIGLAKSSNFAGGAHLFFFGWNCGVAGDQSGHDASSSLNSQAERCHIEQQQLLDLLRGLPIQNRGLKSTKTGCLQSGREALH